jgi:hypothetical protein
MISLSSSSDWGASTKTISAPAAAYAFALLIASSIPRLCLESVLPQITIPLSPNLNKKEEKL